MTKSKGVGDTIAKITKATGIDKVAKKVLGEDCGCDERRKLLNKLLPYGRQFTKDEMSIYETVMKNVKDSVLTSKDQMVLIRLYNKVFNANKKVSGCSSCVKGTMERLKKVYENSCKIEDNE